MEPIGPIDVEERKRLRANFTRDLGTASIQSVAWSCEAVGGSDPDAALRLVGGYEIEGAVVSQDVAGMHAGVTYNLRCKVTDTAGGVHVAAALLSATRLAV